VQIIENWSEVSGVVRSRKAADREGFDLVAIAVDRVEPVPGYANLLEKAEGSELDVLMPEEIVASNKIGLGDAITCRVRLGNRRQAFVHREHITVRRAPGKQSGRRDE
jgi:hypothetical protein